MRRLACSVSSRAANPAARVPVAMPPTRRDPSPARVIGPVLARAQQDQVPAAVQQAARKATVATVSRFRHPATDEPTAPAAPAASA
ncbi:hypothetical protein ACFRSX_18495 [Streptomyces goshikiensis]|uniref:hypothetical protein n=1 Tax=Streptomyces TaxID=1883 RepID=UPI00131D2DCD|nr:hypothetical protein [Streptomyces sp. CB02120-2]